MPQLTAIQTDAIALLNNAAYNSYIYDGLEGSADCWVKKNAVGMLATVDALRSIQAGLAATALGIDKSAITDFQQNIPRYMQAMRDDMMPIAKQTKNYVNFLEEVERFAGKDSRTVSTSGAQASAISLICNYKLAYDLHEVIVGADDDRRAAARELKSTLDNASLGGTAALEMLKSKGTALALKCGDSRIDSAVRESLQNYKA